jgi:hypothetical protein
VAAAAEGRPDDLTRKELAAYTVRTLAVAFILQPMEFGIRIQNRLGYAAIALILLLPVPPLAWSARRRRIGLTKHLSQRKERHERKTKARPPILADEERAGRVFHR